MENAKSILFQLCHTIQIEILSMEMPNYFPKAELEIDHNRKSDINLSKHIYKYFDKEIYEIKINNKLKAQLKYTNQYGQKVIIIIEMYEPCWRLEYLYRIYYTENTFGPIWYFCNFEKDNINIEGALQNLVLVTQYIKQSIEEKFNKLIRDN